METTIVYWGIYWEIMQGDAGYDLKNGESNAKEDGT